VDTQLQAYEIQKKYPSYWPESYNIFTILPFSTSLLISESFIEFNYFLSLSFHIFLTQFTN
jgi:hypothetical protein